MIILIGIHAIRVYLMGSYKYPRQINWLTGVGLLLFTVLMANAFLQRKAQCRRIE